MVPTIPSASLLLPVVAPVLAPMRRNIHAPAGKIGWSLPKSVVARAAGTRHILRSDLVPRAIVPAARIPVVVLVHPIQAVVKEVIRMHMWVVVDR